MMSTISRFINRAAKRNRLPFRFEAFLSAACGAGLKRLTLRLRSISTRTTDSIAAGSGTVTYWRANASASGIVSNRRVTVTFPRTKSVNSFSSTAKSSTVKPSRLQPLIAPSWNETKKAELVPGLVCFWGTLFRRKPGRQDDGIPVPAGLSEGARVRPNRIVAGASPIQLRDGWTENAIRGTGPTGPVQRDFDGDVSDPFHRSPVAQELDERPGRVNSVGFEEETTAEGVGDDQVSLSREVAPLHDYRKEGVGL